MYMCSPHHVEPDIAKYKTEHAFKVNAHRCQAIIKELGLKIFTCCNNCFSYLLVSSVCIIFAAAESIAFKLSVFKANSMTIYFWQVIVWD